MRFLSSVALRPFAAALVLLPAFPIVAHANAATGTEIVAYLDGESVIGGGDEDAGGDFTAMVNGATGQICYTFFAEDVAVTSVNLHEGKEEKAGAVVLALEVTGEKGPKVCASVDAKVAKAIISKPGNFYVQAQTEASPKGAMRGQMESGE